MTTSATTRMTRLVGVFASVCVLLYLAGYSPQIVEQGTALPWWTAATVIGEGGLAVAVIVAARRRADHVVKKLSFAWSAVYVVAEVAWRPLTGGTTPPESTWHQAYPALATIYLTPYLATGAIVLLSLVVLSYSKIVAADHVVSPELIGSLLHGYLFGGFTIVVPLTLVSVAGRRDAEEHVARVRSAAAAAAEAESIERERVDGLIHDSVMSTLLAASRIGGGREVAAGASSALTDLAFLREVEHRDDGIDITSFLGLFRSSLHFLDPTLDVTVRVDDAALWNPVPGDVARALTSAAGEALRNSLRHAGPCHRRASLHIAAGGRDAGTLVTIEIEDDGRGFDPHSVPTDRLGLRASITGRLEALPGGRAEVRSARGSGTRVLLTWSES